MKKRYLNTFVTALVLSAGALTSSAAAAENPNFGIVNFANCIQESKLGQQEQASFENLKKQLGTHLEETEKQINELAAKFNDAEFMDGLSPEAEEELKVKIRTLNEELSRYQNQYYQVLNQANMRVIQTISANINTAAEKVAKDKKLTMVVNKDACFFYSPALDVTNLVIAEMDKTHELEVKKQAAAVQSQAAPQQQATEKKAG